MDLNYKVVIRVQSKVANKRYNEFAKRMDAKKRITESHALNGANIGSVTGGAGGVALAGLSLRGLKGKLRKKHPKWTDAQIDREYAHIAKNRVEWGLYGGATAGMLVGGLAGAGTAKYKMNRDLNKIKKIKESGGTVTPIKSR